MSLTAEPDVASPDDTDEQLRSFVEGSGIPGTVELVEAAAGARKGLTVEVTLIREGFGNERDRHYYGANALQEALPLFQTGRVKMYINHLTDAQKKDLQGLPRPVEQHGARLLDAWMSESADSLVDGRPRKEIRGRALIAHPLLAQMVEADPEALGTSIDARGRAADAMREGRPARDVTHMTRVLSTDFVTEAGANGKVDRIVESFIEAAGEETRFELVTAHEQGEHMETHELGRSADERIDGLLDPDEVAAIEAELEIDDEFDGDDSALESDDHLDVDVEAEDDLGEGDDDEDEEAAMEEARRGHAHHRMMAARHKKLAEHHRARGNREKAKHHREKAKHHASRMREAAEEYELINEAWHSRVQPKAGFDPFGTGSAPAGDLNGPSDVKDKAGGIGTLSAPGTTGQDHRFPKTGALGERPASAGHLHSRVKGHKGARHHGVDRRRGLGHMVETGDIEGIEELVTEMASELADQVVEETLEAGLAAARDEYERQLTEAGQRHEAELARVRQSYQASSIIDADPDLPEGAKRTLRESFYERGFDARVTEDGTEVPAEQVMREAVVSAIAEKKGAVEVFTEARVKGMGSTATPSADTSAAAGGRRRRGRGGLDKELDSELQIPHTTPKEQ